MKYNVKDQPVGNGTYPIGAHKQLILLFDETLDIQETNQQGIVFILGIILLYVLLILWSLYKDRKKQTFAPHLEGKELHISQSKTDQLQEIGLDYTAETLEATTMGTDVRDYSNIIMSTQGEPSPNARSPTPQSTNSRRQRSFDFNKARRRRSNNRSASPHTPNRSSNDIPPNSVDLSDISRGAPSTDVDRTGLGGQSSVPDDSMFRRGDSRRVRGGPPTAVIKRRQTVKSKFCKLMNQRHIILSTIRKMSTISPRWKRVGLLYFLFNLNLFLMSTSFISNNADQIGAGMFFVCIGISWVIFGVIAKFSSVSKDRLKDTITTEDFQKALYSLQQESKMKNICLHFIIFIFCIFAFCQYGLFITNYKQFYASWIGVSIFAFLSQVILDSMWLIIMAKLYTKAYGSRTLRRMYRAFNACRFWNV